MKHRLFGSLFILSLALLAGCFGYGAGGQRSANDLYTYESTPEMPMTVVVRDWSTKHEFLNVDIPVGQQLVIQFHKNKNKKHDPSMPDTMHWRLMPLGERSGKLTNTMPVVDENHRMVDWYQTGKAPGQTAIGR